MKTSILHKAATIFVGATFALTAMTVRADEPKKDADTTTAHHHKRAAAKAESAETRTQLQKRNNQAPIPTRDGRNATYSSGAGVGGSNGAERSVLTGSHLPRTYHRRGYTTDSQDNQFIYDRNDIRLQSTNSVGESLRSVPGVRHGVTRKSERQSAAPSSFTTGTAVRAVPVFFVSVSASITRRTRHYQLPRLNWYNDQLSGLG